MRLFRSCSAAASDNMMSSFRRASTRDHAHGRASSIGSSRSCPTPVCSSSDGTGSRNSSALLRAGPTLTGASGASTCVERSDAEFSTVVIPGAPRVRNHRAVEARRTKANDAHSPRRFSRMIASAACGALGGHLNRRGADRETEVVGQLSAHHSAGRGRLSCSGFGAGGW